MGPRRPSQELWKEAGMIFNTTSCGSKRYFYHLSIMAIGALLPVAGYSQQAARGETTTLERKSVADLAEREARPYHTREGRLQAKPLDWSSTIGKPTRGPKKPPVKGEPATSRPGAPNPNAKPEGQRLYPGEWPNVKKPGGPQGRLDGRARLVPVVGTPDVFTQFCENCLVPNTDYPMATIGKLFLNGGFCSASVISGNNVIVTAAHCCYDRNNKRFTGGWVFAPAYDNGNTPFGVFDWTSATVLNSWINNVY